jgi:signal transduction histidine kinase
MKVQHKILLLLFGFFITTIGIYTSVIYFALTDYAYEDFYKRLEIRAITTAKIHVDKHSENTAALRELRREYLERLSNEHHYIFSVDEHTDFSQEADSMGVPESFLHNIRNRRSATYYSGNIFYTGILYHNSIVVVSATNYYNAHHMAYLRGLLFAAIAFVLLFTFFFALLFARLIFRPISRITKSVNAISTENLHLRLEVHNSEDELGQLTATYNNMLDRLETSFETQNNFISNASHELSTPLTSIIGVADVALSKPRTPQEYVDALQVVAGEAEKLDRKTKALLFLAQTGFNGKTVAFDEVRVDQLVIDTIATVKKIHPAARIEMDLDLLPENPEKLRIRANAQLLHLALSNIITNGCKYSGNKPVKIAIGVSDTNVLIVIRDEGIGIPANEIRYIYDPFFRASNTGPYEGYGIGLPLTRNILKLHHGDLLVTSIEHRGTTVQLTLPVSF